MSAPPGARCKVAQAPRLQSLFPCKRGGCATEQWLEAAWVLTCGHFTPWRRNDTIAHNDELMMNVVRQVGVDRIVMGSDYCFQIGDEHPVATVNRLSKSISVAEREMILGKTAARLLKL